MHACMRARTAVNSNMDSENRFATLAERELKEILDDKDSKKTKDVVKYALRIFDSYCAEKGINVIKIETKTAQDLCSPLVLVLRRSAP